MGVKMRKEIKKIKKNLSRTYLIHVYVGRHGPAWHRPTKARYTKGLFGWAVAVEKVAVGCELWKKLL
jgi:hypothetical protein